MSQLWMQTIEEGLEEIKEIPLWGALPSFDWRVIGDAFAKEIGIEELSLSPKAAHWHNKEDLLHDLGTHPFLIAISATPVDGVVYVAMSKADAAGMTTALLSKEGNGKGFSDPSLQEGFLTYLFLEALSITETQGIFEDLVLNIVPFTAPEESSLCTDVEIEIGERTFWARFICPSSFLRSLKGHFSTRSSSVLSSHRRSQIEVPLSLEIGKVALPQQKWKDVVVGDCILLDRCSLDLKTHKGTATAFLGKTALFRARIKQDQIKVLDYAFYHEEETTMDDQDEENREIPAEEGGTEEPLWGEGTTEEEVMIPTEEIPIVLTVEAGKIKINLDKLLQLAPGNVIELPLKPEAAVHLTINGKAVAKGELVKIGDAVGVKILKIGR